MGGNESVISRPIKEDPPIPDDSFDIESGFESNLLLCKNGRIENRFDDGTMIVRMLSLEPTCCCYTPNNGWIIGFKTGNISEFDSNLQLINSFTRIGSRNAHSGPVKSLCMNLLENDDSNYLLSVANENALFLWDRMSHFVKSFKINSTITAVCSSAVYIWISDANGKVYSIDHSWETHNIQCLSPVSKFVTFNMGLGCICALFDGSIDIISGTESIAHFTYGIKPKITNLIPLETDQNNGLITFAVVDDKGVLSTRILDVYGEEIDEISPFFCLRNNKIYSIKEGKIVTFDVESLKNKAKKLLNEDIELPRKKIVSFLLDQ